MQILVEVELQYPRTNIPSIKTSEPSLIGDLIPSTNSIDVGVVLKIFDFMAFVPISIEAIFIMNRHYIL